MNTSTERTEDPANHLAWEMAVWEVHRMRTELQAVTLRIAIYAHGHPDADTLVRFLEEARRQLETDQARAMLDPVLRRLMPANP